MSNLKQLLEYLLIREESMYHTTDPKNVPSILSKGLKINPGFDQGGKSIGSVEMIDAQYNGVQPIFLSKEPGAYKGGKILKVDIDGLPLVADIPGLVDFGGELTDHSVYWDDMSVPEEIRDLEDPETGEPLNGELEYEYLREPNNDISNTAINLTGTGAVPEDIDPTRIEPLESLFNAWYDKKNIKKHFPKEQLTEAHFGKFNMSVFKRLTNIDDKIAYCDEHLRPMGLGSSRATFALSTNSVLKVVYAGKRDSYHRGIAQNKAEVEVWTNPKTKSVAAKIFDFDGEEYEWLVMEPAQQISYETFRKLLNLPRFFQQIDNAINIINGDIEINDILNNIKRWDDPTEENINNIIEYCENPPPFVTALAALVKNNNLSLCDIDDGHFGKTADGRVVLFDYGCTEEVWDAHYAR